MRPEIFFFFKTIKSFITQAILPQLSQLSAGSPTA